MYKNYKEHLDKTLNEIREAGLYKNERIIISPQGAEIELESGQKVLNFCANNYLGLSNSVSLIEAAKVSTRRPWIWNVIGEVHLRHNRSS